MTVVVYELNDDRNYEALGSHTDQDDVENEDLLSIFPEEVWQDRSEEWITERIDGPYVMATIQDEEPEEKTKVGMWTPYVGPNGGEGYQHMLTDEVRYVEEEPTDDEAPGNDVDVDEPQGDELEDMTGISDASYIKDNLPVTATWENRDGDSFVGQIEEVDYGGMGETFVIAATNGRRYEVDGDDLTGYIEPTPEYNPRSDEEDQRIHEGFERTKEQLPDGVIPERPTPNMGNGGPRPETDEFRHIGEGRITEEHVEELQRIVDTGDTGNIQVGIEAVGENVDYGAWDANTDNLSWFDGGQFANIDVEMPIEDFLATQTDMLSSDRNHPQEAYESFHRVRTDDVEEYAEVLQEQPGEMPMPYIEFGRNGNMRNSQEGRHRALAARMAGFDTLPVRFVINAERDGKGVDERVDWSQDLEKLKKGTDWRPYLGPRGGEGWIKPFNFSDDRIVYDEDPPGDVSPEYSEDYWHDRPSPVNENIVNMVESHLEGVRGRPYKLDEPTANFFEEGLESGYHPNAVSEAAEWYLKSMEKEIGDGGRLEEDDVQKVLRDASTQFLDRQTEQEIEIEGGERGGGTISLGEIDNNFKRDWWDNFESEIGYTDDQMTNEKPAYSAIRNWSMTSQMFSSSTAPLIKAAIQESDNDFIPTNGEEVRETEVSEQEIEHVLEYKEAMTDLYRSVYGDTVPCFRGIDGQSSQIDGLREDIQEGKPIELPEATLSSWATEPGTAMRFAGNIHTDGYREGGVVIRQEVPVEQLFVTGDTHPGLLNNENELVVNAPESVTRYEADELVVPTETTPLEQAVWAAERANRDTDASEEAAKAVQRAFLSKQDVNRYSSIAIENYDWFREVAGEQTQPETKAKEWIPYEGPRGGEGWQNTEDRQDIRYGLEDPPGEVEEGYEDMAEDWGPGEEDVKIPEKFEGEYRPEDITPIPGDPTEWGDEFPISEGQTLLGENWEWTVENVWYQDSDTHAPEPRMELAIPSGISHTFGYVSDSVKLQDMEPGWHKNPSIPNEDSQQNFVGVVGEPESQDVGFNPTGEAANAAFDLDEAAARMAGAVGENNWERYEESEYYVGELLEEHDPSYATLKALVTHGLEANGERLREERDISTAEDIILNGIKIHLQDNAVDHPSLKGELDLGDRNDELFDDFQSRMTPDTRETTNDAMASWISGRGSMVDERTIPIYRQAAQTYENDFYPTRGNVDILIDSAEDLEERQEQFERYRQKTVETFREVFGDTVPVFRGYDPGEQSKGDEARKALQAEDGPTQIEIRNGVANSWSTDPTVAYKFSTWNNDDTPGIVVRQQLPVEQIFGSSDTAADVRSDEAEIVAGNPEEFTNHSRDDVFLPEEFDPVEQMRWALSGIENDGADEEKKADEEALSLDWELESVGWMKRYRDLEEALDEKNWTPIEVGNQSGYQHVVSGSLVKDMAGIKETTPVQRALHSDYSQPLKKEWKPYRGPQDGEGWQNANDPDDIRYGLEDPPGEVAEGYEEQAEDWGPSDDEDPERVQGATIIDYNVPNTDEDLQIPKNFTGDDLKETLRRFRDDGQGNLLTELANQVQFQQDGSLDDKMDVLHGTAEVLGNRPEIVGQFNDLLHEEIAGTPNADFEVPFGMDGPAVHDMLEDTFGRFSDIVGDLEDMVLFDDSVNEDKAENWVVAAEGWIRNYGDREMADNFRDAIADAELMNPFSNTEEYAQQEEISDDLNPANAERVVPISETKASTGISADSMFISQYEDGHRAFVTNTSHHRSDRVDGVTTQDEIDGDRVMAGYKAFKAAGMDVPRHERLKSEYWTVEEADGEPARKWDGEPDEEMREQFAKLGAVAMLSGNWDLHGGNVFVSEEGDLVPVDLDLAGHDIQSRGWKNTSWGRLKGLGRTLNMYETRGDDNDTLELKQDVAQATQELVEDGTADDIKSMASEIDNKDIQMAIEENVFAAKGGRLYDDRVRGEE